MVQDKGEIQKIHPVQFSSQIEKYYSFYENLKMVENKIKIHQVKESENIV